jgi:hypothetical protein
MGAARRFLTAAAVLAVGGAAVTAGGAGAQGEVTLVSLGFLSSPGGVRGIVVARQIGPRTRAQVHFSLHGLAPRTAIQVLEVTRPCSRALPDPNRERAAVGVWEVLARTTDSGAAFKVANVTLRRSLSTGRSIRVYEFRGGRFVQRACGSASTYNSGTGVLT